jgi:putative glutamine amidotransferase
MTKNLNAVLLIGDGSYARPFVSDEYVVICKHWKQLTAKDYNNPDWKAVVFTGGADIHPSRYEQTPAPEVYCDKMRDAYEFTAMGAFTRMNIPLIGVCRGMQLFNIFSGGKMVQHMVGHNGSVHVIQTYDGKEFMVNSLHHQMCLLPDDAVLLAWGENIAVSYAHNGQNLIPKKEPEVVWYPKINAIGVQFHPEMMNDDTVARHYFKGLIREYAGL